ncbi:response regulator [Microbacterium album]|uniref:DNA-binding response regulator n=1 Tax=Microbacterium album TaxID=2053191 RepID=A0A917IJU0_9MICO|nr:response regulator transcription factor [Microbacterium album]GGH51148.1 DNA-binding response regulator [Microbacterium album]
MIGTLIVDDARAVRKSVRELLEATDDIEVIGEASNGRDAVQLARALRPDVVLMDLRMPDGDGLDAIEALSGIGVTDPIPIIAFTTFHLDEYVYGALERGAVGFLLKKNPGDIPAAIRAAVNANALQSPAIRERLMADYARSGRARHPRTASTTAAQAPSGEPSLSELLTERELEVVAGVAHGLSNREISQWLTMSENTVKWHIANMLDKTGASNRTQLAHWASQRGLNP